MNTSRLRELKRDLKRYQRSYQAIEETLNSCEPQYIAKLKADILEIEESYCNALEEISKIKTFLYGE